MSVRMMMMMMMVAVHVWCLQIRIEPVCGLAFTFSLHTGPPSTSLITVWAKLFEKTVLLGKLFEKQLAALFEKMQNATRKCLRKQFERTVWAKLFEKLFENCLRQDYKEMFSTRLVTNYFQWIMSTLWQIFHWSQLRRISTGDF